MWILLSGKNAGQACGKSCSLRSSYCSTHQSKAEQKDREDAKKARDNEYFSKYGVTYDTYIAQEEKKVQDERDKEERDFVALHGMSSMDYRLQEYEKEREAREAQKQKEESERKDSLLKRIRDEPDFQLNNMTAMLQDYVEGFFDPHDGYMDGVRDILVDATPNGTITLSDGRKFKVGFIPILE